MKKHNDNAAINSKNNCNKFVNVNDFGKKSSKIEFKKNKIFQPRTPKNSQVIVSIEEIIAKSNYC